MRITMVKLIKMAVFIALCASLTWWWFHRDGDELMMAQTHFYSLDFEANMFRVLSAQHGENDASVHAVAGNFRSPANAQLPGESKQSQGGHLCDAGKVCREWNGRAKLSITESGHGSESAVSNTQCIAVKWESNPKYFTPHDCFDLTSASWYGGAEHFTQHWPANRQQAPLQAYQSNDFLAPGMFSMYGPILEPHWISSTGVGIRADSDIPMKVSFNDNGDGKLCLAADFSDVSLDTEHDGYRYTLGYNICVAEDVRAVQTLMSSLFIKKPTTIPDERALRSPIWSTWARYKTAVNESHLLAYADEITKHGFTHSQLEIDDMYTTTYGDFNFNPQKFPNIKSVLEDLYTHGFRVTTWVTPFVNVDSAAFLEGVQQGDCVLNENGTAPALVRWWQGVGCLLDVTNPAAVLWYTNRLHKFQEKYGLLSFKFDAGEANYFPRRGKMHDTLRNPVGEYTAQYAKLVAGFGGAAEMRSGWGSGNHPILYRMMDKDSRWGHDNGLRTLIPNALLMGLLGYQFILPDMIGGNAYNPDSDGGLLDRTVLPSRELYVRWVQLCAFLPAMQFSITPWQYDDHVVRISRRMVELHETLVTPIILTAAKQYILNGEPIIRPLWWHSPTNNEALTSDSQFLVGDEILVAPVVDEGSIIRDIYLPRGRWKDAITGDIHSGPKWLEKYPVPLEQIAYFTKT